MLEVRDLRVKYGNRTKPAVDGLTFTLEHGEFALLMGDSASGKSTAMQAICGFIPEIISAEKSGEIRIGGKVHDSAMDISRIACMVQQDPETQFCTETVEDEVAFGPENFSFSPAGIRSAVDNALKSVGGTRLLNRGLSTLSGGEKQKVAIASMLAAKPKLLVLDEPTSNLDPHSVSEILKVIDHLRRSTNMTLVVVEHRARGFLDMASKILVMESGRLVKKCARGSPEFTELESDIRQPGMYPRVTKRTGTVLSATGLSYEIDGYRILDEISLVIRDGSIVAIIGPNGAGKTTLLRHITGLVRPQKGTVQVFSRTMDNNHPTEPWVLGKDVGYVFQNPNHQILEKTVDSEIRFASSNFGISGDEASRSIEDFERSEGVRRFVHPHCLSFGQKRRVCLRAASSHGPGLVLLDEPFVGQDARNTDMICEILARLQRGGKTIVLVTHDIDFAKAYSTDAILMKAGRIVAQGATDEIPDSIWSALFEEGQA